MSVTDTGGERTLLDAKPSPAFRNPMLVLTLGLYWFWYKRTLYRVTERHLSVHRGVFRRDEDEVPLIRVAAVKAKLSPLFGASRVEAATGAGEHTVTIAHLNRKAARAFAEALNGARADVRERTEGSHAQV
jgi:membrane protein YdbS with pleckstrin-like domain